MDNEYWGLFDSWIRKWVYRAILLALALPFLGGAKWLLDLIPGGPLKVVLDLLFGLSILGLIGFGYLAPEAVGKEAAQTKKGP